jgi:integrase
LRLDRFLIDRWLPSIRSTVRASTFTSYAGHVRHHISPRIGQFQIDRIDARILNELYSELLVSGRADKRGGLSPVTVRRVHATLHRAFRDATRWGLLDSNPASRCDPPKARAHHAREMKTWSAQDLKRFLLVTASEPLGPLWHVLAMTGLRRGEGLGLRWCDVDLARGVLLVRQTIVAVGSEVQVSSPKTARGRRVVALDREAQLLLASLAHGGLSDSLVFNRQGAPLHPVSVSKAFKRSVERHALPRIRLNDLRHTHATLALEAGVHPKIVSERLGHSTVALTLDIYSHALDHMQAEAAAQIGVMVWGQAP